MLFKPTNLRLQRFGPARHSVEALSLSAVGRYNSAAPPTRLLADAELLATAADAQVTDWCSPGGRSPDAQPVP